VHIDEYYADLKDPDTGDLGVETELRLNGILLSAAMIFRMMLLIRYLIAFSRFRSGR
jgi:hypothetical protein